MLPGDGMTTVGALRELAGVAPRAEGPSTLFPMPFARHLTSSPLHLVTPPGDAGEMVEYEYDDEHDDDDERGRRERAYTPGIARWQEYPRAPRSKREEVLHHADHIYP